MDAIQCFSNCYGHLQKMEESDYSPIVTMRPAIVGPWDEAIGPLFSNSPACGQEMLGQGEHKMNRCPPEMRLARASGSRLQ